MTPFTALDYQTACIEAEVEPLYQELLQRREAALDDLGDIREDINLELQQGLICTDTNGF